MPSRYRRRALIATLAGGAALLAACSSSGSASSSASTSSSAAAATGSAASATGSAAASNAIVVGGVQDGNYTGIAQGFDARIARFNKEGGIQGRKIQLVGVLNDGGSPSTNLADVQTLVLKDDVFAVTPYSSQAWSPSSSALIAQHNLPYIGWAINPAACIGDGAFPINGCTSSGSYSSTYGWTLVSEALHLPLSQLKIALIGIDNAGGAGGTKAETFSAQSAGTDVVYSAASIPQGGTTDYSPYVQAILAKNPNVVQLITDFATGASLTAALREAGYKGTIVNPTAYVPGLLTAQKQLAEALQGSLVNAEFPPQEGDSAGAKQALADLQAIGQPAELTLGVQIGWYSADEFIQELQATAKAGPLTPANFVKTIHAGFSYKSAPGGLAGISFPALQLMPSSCGGLMLVKPDGTYTVAAGFSCDQAKVVKVS